MITIVLHPRFKKSYKTRVAPFPSLSTKTKNRIRLFQTNVKNPILNNHQLKGSKQGDHAFSITGDVRIVYRKLSAESVLFLDIGTHNQVY